MKIDILNQKGKTVDTMESKLFEEKLKENIVSQYLRVFLMNKRQGTASTKTRAEVSGGGKKPWRQKHTGRSRQGSIRSPIWVHGGTAHGPKPKDWSLKMSVRARTSVLQMVLSQKFKEKNILVVEGIELKDAKTKTMVEFLSGLNVEGKVLLVWSEKNDYLLRSSANISGLEVTEVKNLNPYQIMFADYVVMDKGALKILQDKIK